MYNLGPQTMITTNDVYDLVCKSPTQLSILNASQAIPHLGLREDDRIKNFAQEGRIPGAVFFDLDKIEIHDT